MMPLFLCLSASVLLTQAPAAAAAPAPGGKVHIGTYDSRAIAVAYAPSRFNPVKEKMAEFEKAKAAGDAAKMKELQTWGEQFQRQLHFQGFGRVPVDDLLAPVKEHVARLGRERGLAAITMSCEFTGPDVELVDVTDDLVKLFEPSEKTLDMVRQVRKVPPTPLPQLDKTKP